MRYQSLRLGPEITVSRRTRWVGVGVSGRDVRPIELLTGLDQGLWNGNRLPQLLKQIGNGVTPRVGAKTLEDSLERFLGRLLGGKTGPIVETRVTVMLSVSEVALGLRYPVSTALHASGSVAAPNARLKSRPILQL
jgi:hypothetical protein